MNSDIKMLKVEVNPDHLSIWLNNLVVTSFEMVGYGFLSTESFNPVRLALPGQLFQIERKEGGKIDNPEKLKQDYRMWLIANGLRDCVEGLGFVLEEARKACIFYSIPQKKVFLADELLKHKPFERHTGFERRPLEDKFKYLKKNYNYEPPEKTRRFALTINKARNCIVHRKGIVEQKDCNDGNKLLVEWYTPVLTIGDINKASREINKPGELIRGGEILSLIQKDTNKKFKIGEAIVFDINEFSSLCWTFIRCGAEISKSLKEFGESKGIKPSSDKA